MRWILSFIFGMLLISCTPDKYIGIVKAYDKNPKQVLSYSIISGNTGNAFAIDKTTGSVRIASKKAIDQSGQSYFILKVSVSDDGKMWSSSGFMYFQDKPMSSTASITILKSAWTK